MTGRPTIKLFLLITLATLLGGCATQFQPRYGHDGIYYDQPQRVVHQVPANPAAYPFWSLDWFYFIRHYHPYSVLVSSYDPWFYPYPGWYYGYRPGFRSHVSLSWGGYYHPWYGRGFAHVRPWQPYPVVYYPYRPHEPRVRVVDERLNEAGRRNPGDRRISRLPPNAPAGAERIATDRRVIQSSPQGRPVQATSPRLQPTPRSREPLSRSGTPRQQSSPPPRGREIQRATPRRQSPAPATRNQGPATGTRSAPARQDPPLQPRQPRNNRPRERVQPP